MLEIKEVPVEGYKRVIEVIDPQAKLHGFIAIHDTTLGPALGGTRIYPYATTHAALNDVLRLAKGMTYKSALAQCGLGGGKSVIIADPHTDKTRELLLAFARAVERLHGEYIAAEDLGSDTQDMLVLRKRTHYVSALPTDASSGDPSPYTAWGVFKGIQAVAQQLWGNSSLRNKRVLIQGLGHVGSKLAKLLFWEGADLILSDVEAAKMHALAHQYGAESVDPQKIFSVECDIFCPCALGGILNEVTIPHLRCKGVAGAANNQLATPEDGKALLKRNILYAPDFVINAGGLINVSMELELQGYDPKAARDKVDRLYEILLAIFLRAKEEEKPTSEVADAIAEYNLRHKIGARTTPVHLH